MTEDTEATVSDIQEGLATPAKPKGAKKVAKKVKKAEADESPKGKKAKKVEKSNGKSNGHTEKSDDGLITVAELADEAGISAQSARVKLRAAELDRGEGRWKWEPGSKTLKSARKILGLDA